MNQTNKQYDLLAIGLVGLLCTGFVLFLWAGVWHKIWNVLFGVDDHCLFGILLITVINVAHFCFNVSDLSDDMGDLAQDKSPWVQRQYDLDRVSLRFHSFMLISPSVYLLRFLAVLRGEQS